MLLSIICAVIAVSLIALAVADEHAHGQKMTTYSHNLTVCSRWWIALAVLLFLLEVFS